jgi:hypothetical protein
MKDKILEIANNILTQDNRITDQPIFIVERLRKDYGYDSGWADDYVWCNTADSEECIDEDDEQYETLNEQYDLGEIDRGWYKCYYKTRWEYVTACFTEQGCKDHITANGHNLGKTRIYADGSYRNFEFRDIRNYLLSLIQPDTKGEK